ncbi:tail protein [Xenorhabdus stockiae]|uniref:Tail protein n=1 Tax=Xenorhabdus stockiae TaxID=351614 RepID=A0A2D0KWA0_9GAMM|nr:phage tail protein [Xenorhabdus stockiae]PHM67682.1 tail protein [Xenorhabdus stockiae]
MQDNKPDVPVSDESNLVIVATPEYVKEAIAEHAASRNHPDATLQDKGFVVLSNDVSDSETMAATPKAVKTAYDLANTANQAANSASNLASTASDKADNANDLANTANNLANTANENANLALPVGVPVPWPTENPPEGWLICNGETFDKGKYPKLALAYPSGVLPDLRGEFIRGWDNSRGVDNGRTLMSWQDSDNKSHVHDDLGAHGGEAGGIEGQTSLFCKSYFGGKGQYSVRPDSGWKPGFSNGLTSLPSGGDESRPRNIAFNYIVRAA